ncbi:hypothetical protein SADUNF_Sadunf11G0015600 [Salix dunnii]|uniref:Gnk2-homologous domain-containing protein n=1 Tax=Salix dunnii TaxID=1413687 RepID=A0A835JJ50_9ROSI|nr:hypothetical protein SADUNF_Sadunf11G0015600 [Salix dunnii]
MLILKKIMFLLLNPTSFLSILITIITLISSTSSEPTYTYHFCSHPQNSTENTNYDSNLSALLSSLSSKASLNSFYEDSSNGIYSLYLCRGDVSSNTCQTCINTATEEIQRQCASNGTAIIWYDECMLRYSIRNFLGVYQTSPRLLMWNIQNTTSPDELNFDALALIYTMIGYIPYTDMMFGTKQSASHDGSQNRYAMVQCSRDINSSNCSSCLKKLSEAANQCCQSKRGWRILAPSCSLRYEEYEFYQVPSTPVPVPSAPGPEPVPVSGGNGGNNTTKIVIATVISSLAAVAWQLWNEGRGKELIDRNIVDSCPISEALRWIHIALLCIQDDPARRPTMSLVVLMLGSNAVNLPRPSAGPNSLVKFTSILSHQSSATVSGSSFLASDLGAERQLLQTQTNPLHGSSSLSSRNGNSQQNNSYNNSNRSHDDGRSKAPPPVAVRRRSVTPPHSHSLDFDNDHGIE